MNKIYNGIMGLVVGDAAFKPFCAAISAAVAAVNAPVAAA